MTARAFSAADLAGLPGMPSTVRSVTRIAERDAWPREKRVGRGGGWVYPLHCLPPETQAALAIRFSAPPAAANDEGRRIGLWAMYDRKPDKIKAEAQRRLQALDAVQHLIAGGKKKLAANAAVAVAVGKHSSTIRRWEQLVAGFDRSDWLPALAPKWNGRTPDAECSVEAWEYFKADLLRDVKPRVAACYRRLQEAAAKNGWTIPSQRTLERRVERELPPAVIALAKGGPDALKRMFPAQRRDHTVFAALEAINGDGHTFDVFVRKDGKVFRPVLLAWQDIYSGKWLGWRVGADECAELVRLSFSDVVRYHGLPTYAYLDNGRAFAAKWNTGGIPNRFRFKVKEDEPEGVFKLLGVQVHWTLPFSGQSKPIERGFQDVIEEISKHPACQGAYTGSNPMAKPASYGSRAIEFDEFVRLVDDRMRALNARQGRRSPACAGRSFNETFDESYARLPVRKATEEQLRLTLLASEGVTARADTGEIHLYGNVYWSDSMALARMAGQRVVVRFDPQNLSLPMHVYHPNGAYLCAADCRDLAGFNDEAAARRHGKARSQRAKAVRMQLDAERILSASQAAAQLPSAPEPTKPDSKVVRPMQFRAGAAVPAPLTSEQRNQMFADGMRHLGIVTEG